MSRFSLPDWSQVKDQLRPMDETANVQQAYESGFIGAYYDPEEHELLEDVVRREGMPFSAAAAVDEYGLAEGGAGKVILLHKEVDKIGWGERIGYPNQAVGDCVSHGTAKAMGFTLACAITHGDGSTPPTDGIEHRMWPVATEPHYWFRGHGGDGWYAAAAIRVIKEHTGLVLRKDIPGVCDLRQYSARTAHLYGSRRPPDDVVAKLHDHPALSTCECNSFEEVRDMLAAGHCVQSDGGEGFSKTTDENYVARRSGSWAHSMAVTGCIDTDAFKAKYGGPGIVIQNSWGAWNHPADGAKIHGTDQRLPAGAFVALWKDVSRRSYFAISTVKGWPNRKLRDWSFRDLV
jgi:hypothetical protein